MLLLFTKGQRHRRRRRKKEKRRERGGKQGGGVGGWKRVRLGREKHEWGKHYWVRAENTQ